MASIGKLSTGRWQARWREPDGRQRRKTFSRKFDAERFLTGVEGDKLHGTYVDPDAGRIRFKTYAVDWLAAQTFDPSTRRHRATAARSHLPRFRRQRAAPDQAVDGAGLAQEPGSPCHQLPAGDLHQPGYGPVCRGGRRHTDQERLPRSVSA